VDKKTGGAFGYRNWGEAMGPGYPPHSTKERLDGSPLGRHEEHTGDVVSLLEENARLRRLVVELSELILRNVVDRR
jgi:hypothetical protein